MADNPLNNNPDLGTEPELHQRFPRAGYWFGMLPTHPLHQ